MTTTNECLFVFMTDVWQPRAQRTCNEMRAINHHFAQIPSKVSRRRRALAMRLSKYYFLSKHKVYLYTQFAWLAFFCAEEKND